MIAWFQGLGAGRRAGPTLHTDLLTYPQKFREFAPFFGHGCAPKYVRFFSGSESGSESKSKEYRVDSDSDTDSDPDSDPGLGQIVSRPCQELWHTESLSLPATRLLA